MEETRKLKGLPITFNVYAYDEKEVEELRAVMTAALICIID